LDFGKDTILKGVRYLIAFLLSFLACPSTYALIFGDDNRVDITLVEDPAIRELARSTAIITSNYYLNFDTPTTAHPLKSSLHKDINMCAYEPYANDLNLAICSSFLVHEEWIATASHCMTPFACTQNSIVFDFQVSDSGKHPLEIPAENIYACDRIFYPKNTHKTDFALVHLTRPVLDRKPLELAEFPLEIGEPVFVIGNPLGIPTKYADDASIRSKKDLVYYSDIDTFGCNSGSATFSATTHKVFGLVFAGQEDLDFDEVNSCQIARRCPQGGCEENTFQQILDISVVKTALEEALSNRESGEYGKSEHASRPFTTPSPVRIGCGDPFTMSSPVRKGCGARQRARPRH
jgi:hypothetical protein